MIKRKHAEKLIRNGRRIYGGIFKLPDGRRIYLAFRKQSEIFRSGEKSISEAITKGTAAWAIDNDTLIKLRIQGVYIVGILVEDTGDIYLAMMGDFLKAPVLNYSSRGGALQRYLPLDRFLIKLGSAAGIKPKRLKVAA